MEHLPDWTHGVAIKACPLSGVLRQAQKLGFGAECASMGEVKHALALGFEGEFEKISFLSEKKFLEFFYISSKTFLESLSFFEHCLKHQKLFTTRRSKPKQIWILR